MMFVKVAEALLPVPASVVMCGIPILMTMFASNKVLSVSMVNPVETATFGTESNHVL